MDTLSRCPLCNAYTSNTKEGRAAHMKKFHGVNAQKQEPIPPAKKAVIIERVEQRLGLKHFIVPEPLPVPNKMKYLCNRCGPTNNEGYWLTNQTGICEPCVKEDAGLIHRKQEGQVYEKENAQN